MKIFTKSQLKDELVAIRNRNFIPSIRGESDAGVGDTLEHALGIPTNNLPIPNAGEWELKAQASSIAGRRPTSLTTLKHVEPSPRALKWIVRVLIPEYGRPHQEAGVTRPIGEKTFRQTLFCNIPSNGWMLTYDELNDRFIVTGNGITPENCPYWGVQDLFCIVRTKLLNCVYAVADRKRIDGAIWFHYKKYFFLSSCSQELFKKAVIDGEIAVDFDASTSHNHGTKFRAKPGFLPKLYANVEEF